MPTSRTDGRFGSGCLPPVLIVVLGPVLCTFVSSLVYYVLTYCNCCTVVRVSSCTMYCLNKGIRVLYWGG